ncbi:MAG: EamA family transporter [Eubacteriales bacterium]|nr:EamA family transporter [Eubacteriales bacterium]
MKAEHKAMLVMAATGLFWSLGGVLVKMIPWNAIVLAGVRSLIAGTLIAAYMGIKRIRPLFTKKTWMLGGFLLCTYCCFLTATKLTTAANAIVLQYTAPMFILLYSVLFFRQRFKKADLLAVLFTTLGIALFFLDQLGGGSIWGNLLGVLSGAFMAGMFMASSGVSDQERLSGILIGQLLTAAVGIPLTAVYDTPVTGTVVVCILLLGIVQLGLPYLLYAYAMRSCPPLMASMLSVIEPLLNPIWVLLVIGEAPGKFALIGGAAVLVTITLWCIWNEKHPSEPKTVENT